MIRDISDKPCGERPNLAPVDRDDAHGVLSQTKVAVITGASSGIGEALAHALAGRGYGLLLSANDAPGLQRTASALRSVGAAVDWLEADLSTTDGAGTLARRCEGLDVELLVNNAGRAIDGPFLAQPLSGLSAMMRLNMGTMIVLTRLLLPRMLERGQGTIINVASISAFTSAPNLAVYAASKAFVGSFTESLREELRGSGLRVILLIPGITSGTRFFERLRHNPTDQRPELAIPVEQVVKEAMAALDSGRNTIVTGRRNRLRFWAQQISLRWFGRHAARFIRALRLTK